MTGTSTRRLYPARGRIADAAAPDVRGRSHAITALVRLDEPGGSGVVLAHGDRHAGFALHLADGHLVHEYAHARVRTTTRSTSVVPAGAWVSVAARVTRSESGADVVLSIAGRDVGCGRLPALSSARTGYTGLDIGCDRGVTVGDYPPVARFPGTIRWIDITLAPDQHLDPALWWSIEEATN